MWSQNELNVRQQQLADKSAQAFPAIFVCYVEELWNNLPNALTQVRLQLEQCVQS